MFSHFASCREMTVKKHIAGQAGESFHLYPHKMMVKIHISAFDWNKAIIVTKRRKIKWSEIFNLFTYTGIHPQNNWTPLSLMF